MLPHVYSQIRHGIFAISEVPTNSLSDDESSYFGQILGTGFVVGDSVGLTCRHVIESRQTDDSQTLVAVFLFYHECRLFVVQSRILDVTLPSLENTTEGTETAQPDLAVITLGYSGLDRYSLEIDFDQAPDGTEIATAGYPLGLRLIARGGLVERFGPVLQRGIVSASIPYVNAVSTYLVNIMIQGGASGSPVFRTDNGRVIGVISEMQLHYEFRVDEEFQGNQSLPTNFGYAVSSHKLLRFFPQLRRNGNTFIRTDLPHIDEVLNYQASNCVNEVL